MFETILEKVILYFEEEIEDSDLKITKDSNLMDDLSLSSLEMLKSLVYLETELEVEIPERLLRRMITVGDVAQVICEVLKKNYGRDEGVNEVVL